MQVFFEIDDYRFHSCEMYLNKRIEGSINEIEYNFLIRY